MAGPLGFHNRELDVKITELPQHETSKTYPECYGLPSFWPSKVLWVSTLHSYGTLN
jgi:hypothetical protein